MVVCTAFDLDDQESDSLARKVANLTGETPTNVVRTALRLRLVHERIKRGERPYDEAEIDRIVQRFARGNHALDDAAIDAIIERFDALPTVDSRTADEILGYGDHGLPS